MALSAHDAFAAGRRRGRVRRGRRSPLAEINVTPLVDVMLVLLIIFMISAPLLTAGVPLQLPKTEAGAIDNQNQPLTGSVRGGGPNAPQDRPADGPDRRDRPDLPRQPPAPVPRPGPAHAGAGGVGPGQAD